MADPDRWPGSTSDEVLAAELHDTWANLMALRCFADAAVVAEVGRRWRG